MIYAATGHRLEALGGYDPNIYKMLVEFAVNVLPSFNLETGISGLAIGWDQAFAEGCIQLGIPLIAAVPFKDQANRWPKETKDRHQNILNSAKEVVVVSDGEYANHKFFERDKWMCDKSNALISLWNGCEFGGTWGTIKYAKKTNKPWTNLWSQWINWKEKEENQNVIFE